ncbi:protein TolR [Sphingomonas canadensis]|uniref:Protein TolR n=1 Tax=Sphingomonas canadensis TaxID=1219257 RepID=A0ABW3HA15_9SPHN|nr:protein TolR [Sphingomonas canadensis]MCW3837489.1 protein TolR [Sphingomonas canadensis]
MAMHLPSNKGRGRRAPMAEINVTPLVDVMLVLLIIFMVTAPLLTAGVPVNLPESRAKALQQDAKPVQIAIDRVGDVYVDTVKVRFEELPQLLAPLAQKRDADGKPPQIFLRADQALDYGKVMRVMGELNRAGLNRVSMVTDAASANDAAGSPAAAPAEAATKDGAQ